LTSDILKSPKSVSPDAVLAAGATQLESLQLKTEDLRQVQAAFSSSVAKTIIFALVLACIAVPISALMEWKNVIKEAAGRREQTGPVDVKSHQENLREDA
jgi:hypothetical protein